jgi:hypothetical protein
MIIYSMLKLTNIQIAHNMKHLLGERSFQFHVKMWINDIREMCFQYQLQLLSILAFYVHSDIIKKMIFFVDWQQWNYILIWERRRWVCSAVILSKKKTNSMTGHFRTILMTVSSKTSIKINNSENKRIIG